MTVFFYCSSPRTALYIDFAEVSRRINRAAPDICALTIAENRIPSRIAAYAKSVISSRDVLIQLKRAKIPVPRHIASFHQWPEVNKLEEYHRLTEAGIPLPRWTEILPETVLDPSEWGPYVVVKPSVGRKGAFVRIHKTGRVRYRPPSEYAPGHLGREGPMIAQEFIYTGRLPTAYRVSTYLGRAVNAIRYYGDRENKPLLEEFGFQDKGGGYSIVAAAKGCEISCISDPDVVELAERTHRSVFPEIATMGVDLIRHAATGKLYVVECNMRGFGFLLNSEEGIQIQQKFGLDFYDQFGGLDLIAKTTIQKVRSLQAHAKPNQV